MPFSAAVRVGDLLILSGQIGNLPGTTRLAPGGIKAEAKQALRTLTPATYTGNAAQQAREI